MLAKERLSAEMVHSFRASAPNAVDMTAAGVGVAGGRRLWARGALTANCTATSSSNCLRCHRPSDSPH
jgi:hypothetical protein